MAVGPSVLPNPPLPPTPPRIVEGQVVPEAAPAAPVEPASGGFREFFMQPQVLAAVIQAVQSLASSNRQDTVGRLGDALGAAGAAVGRVQASERATQQAGARQDIARRRAGADEQRADAATARVGLEGDRAGLEREKLGILQSQFERTLKIRKGTQASKLLTAVIEAEIERSFLSRVEPDLERITSQFNIFQELTSPGGAPPPGGRGGGGGSGVEGEGIQNPTAGANFSRIQSIDQLSEGRLVSAFQRGGLPEQLLRQRFGDAVVDAKVAQLRAAGLLPQAPIAPGVLPAFGSNR